MRLPSRRLTKPVIIVSLVFLVLLGIALGALYFVGDNLRQLLSRAPSYSSQELYRQALGQIDQGSYEVAENYLEQALLKEDDATYRNQLAVVKYRLKKYGESVEQYQKLIDIKRDVAFSWNGTGNAYRDWAEQQPASRRPDMQRQAEDAYRASIQADPTYVAAYSNLALLLVGEGRRDEGLQVLDEGIAKTNQSALQEVKKTLSP